MSNYIDDFLNGLEQDKRAPRQNTGLQRIRMDAPMNQGTIVFAPFMYGSTGKFYQFVEGVKEYRSFSSSFKEGKEEAWVKILPKSYYGELTDEESKLYDQVNSLFDEVYDVEGDFHKIRIRTYTLLQGYVINHVDRDKNAVTDNIGKAGILIFPSRTPVDALISAINSKITELNGDKSWIPLVFGQTKNGREGVITLSFEKNPVKAGYLTQLGFGFNTSFSKIIGPDTISDDEVAKMTDNGYKELLTWMNGDNGKLFNSAVFNELKDALIIRLNQEKANQVATDPAPAPSVVTSTDGLTANPVDNSSNSLGTKVNVPF